MIFNLYNEKIINAGSVGFIPYDWEEMEKDESTPKHQQMGRMFKTAELLEHSGCAVPSNPSALQLAIKSMTATDKSKELVYKAVTSNEYNLKSIIDADTLSNIENEIGEIVEKGIEEVDEIGPKVHQVPADIDLEVETEGKQKLYENEKIEYNKDNFIIEETETVEEMLDKVFEMENKKTIEEVEKEFESTFDKFSEEFIGAALKEEVLEYRSKFLSLIKAGAVLNAKNRTRLRQAYDNIYGVLTDAGVQMEEDTESEDSVGDSVEEPKDHKPTRSSTSVYDLALQHTEEKAEAKVVSKPKNEIKKEHVEALSSIAKSMKQLTLFLKSK